MSEFIFGSKVATSRDDVLVEGQKYKSASVDVNPSHRDVQSTSDVNQTIRSSGTATDENKLNSDVLSYPISRNLDSIMPHVQQYAVPAMAVASNIAVAYMDIPENVRVEIERLSLLVVNLSQQTTMLGVSTSILMWVRSRTDTTTYAAIKEFLDKSIFFGEQAGEPSWLRCLKLAQVDWRQAIANASFEKISKLLGLLVSVGMCSISDVTFTVAGFEVMAPDMLKDHKNVLEYTDAVYETVVYFAEGGWLCYRDKSIKPLFVRDSEAQMIDEEFIFVKSCFDLARNGNLEKNTEISSHEFEKRMTDLGFRLRDASKLATHPLDKKLLAEKRVQVASMQQAYSAMRLSAGIRHKPWGIMLYGGSSQGKSTLCDQLLDIVLHSAGLPTDKSYRAFFNASDKYMSSWTSDKVAIIFDDMSNEKTNGTAEPPTRKIIDVINNQMYYAPKAELEGKGKCFVEPWIAVATTNVPHLNAYQYSNCPYSIQNRMVRVTVKARDEYVSIIGGKKMGLDSEKIRKMYTDESGVYRPPPYDDIWDLTVERAIEPDNSTKIADYDVVEFEGKPLKDVGMPVFLAWAISDFQRHQRNQMAMLDAKLSRVDRFESCPYPGCRQLKSTCTKHMPNDTDEVNCGDEQLRCHETKSFGDDVEDEDSVTVPELEAEIGLVEYEIERTWNPKHAWKMKQELAKLENRLKMKKQSGMLHYLARRWLVSKATEPRRYWATMKRDSQLVTYWQARRFTRVFHWVKLMPSWMFTVEELNFVTRILLHPWTMKNFWRQTYWNLFTCLVNIILCIKIVGILSIVIIPFILYRFIHQMRGLHERVENETIETAIRKNMEVTPLIRRVRDEYALKICVGSVGLFLLYKFCREHLANKRRVLGLHPQGSLEPKSKNDVDKRDAEANPWTRVVQRELPLSDRSKRMSTDQLANAVSKSLFYCVLYSPDRDQVVLGNAMALSSNVLLLPAHFLPPDCNLDCTFYKRDPLASGGKFTARINSSCTVQLKGTDVMVAYVPNGGSFKNLLEYFPKGNFTGQVPFEMLYRRNDGEIDIFKGRAKRAIVDSGTEFPGGNYEEFDTNTFTGLCGAPVISKTRGACILGIHLAGTDDTPIGAFGCINQSLLYEALSELRSREGVLFSAQEGHFRPQVLGKNIITNEDLHRKSPLNYMPQNSQVEFLGTCIGRSKIKSNVRVTPMSEHLIDVCDAPNIYCGPKLEPTYYGWQKCLSNLAVPATPYDHDLLSLCVMDYKEPLLPIFKRDWFGELRPLTDDENIMGIAGRRFIDAIKMNTSIGYPLSGPKRNFILEEESPEGVTRSFIPEIQEEIDRAEACYARHERAYPIAKACVKDEILDKQDKCRIFYGNSIALTFLIRKYFLPLMRVLQMNPIVSECAVGVNAHGPEWDTLHKHIFTFGRDRLFGGDYSKYDQKIPSQLILAALRILIDFGKEAGYSDEQLSIMEAMSGDIVYSYIAFNGDLIGLTEGTHISGNSLTVIINGICGSLNLRAYFYHLDRSTLISDGKRFRDCVKVMTYGDDNIGSVSPDINDFTIKDCSKFLAKHGQTYTMPDKNSELADFLPPEEFEFLKRSSVYMEETGYFVGALAERSIFKSLHCYLREKNSPLTEDEACALNIDTALREWFNHGRAVYEKRQIQMKEVARRTNITHMCTELEVTYDQRVEDFKRKYLDEPQEEKVVTFSPSARLYWI